MSEYHNPVLLKESVDSLVINASGAYADATFGGGGHSAEILRRLASDGRLIAFDRDADALANAPDDERFLLIHNNYRFIHNYVLLEQPEGLDGVLADLGVSSHQFDTAERGFSFRQSAPLDMRMNIQGEKTAIDIVNSYTQEELERILKIYGEVDNARRMAALIATARESAPIRTTLDLDNAIAAALPVTAAHKVLAKVYQALRIEVNDELRSLEKFLEGATASLKSGGRMAIITYHSLEDRMVKNYFRDDPSLRVITRKPVLPAESEIAVNTRARSAKLRVAEKI
ncbi:MAG: 16S rRNA (cytosine(1402)-N(4))-methyltransferase RsmH [Bacteroidales bacterium]|nr:16S rRNA (cytosine(1402)-N(4))-methyltransferase RsmH [Bacteroidales bacterium]